MPQITDLTWAQLETALGSNGAISVVGGTIVIKPSLITGDSLETMAASGVVEFMHKIRSACSSAQTTVNNGQAIGDRLAAFPAQTATTPIDGYVTITQQIVSRVPLNTNSIVGPTQ